MAETNDTTSINTSACTASDNRADNTSNLSAPTVSLPENSGLELTAHSLPKYVVLVYNLVKLYLKLSAGNPNVDDDGQVLRQFSDLVIKLQYRVKALQGGQLVGGQAKIFTLLICLEDLSD